MRQFSIWQRTHRRALLCITCAAFYLQVPAAADKPNVLFIFADDQAFDTVHATGNDQIRTPNIDRLVEQGTTFTHAYNQGGWHGAVCVASRTMMVTGRFLWNAKAAEADLKTTWVPKKKLWPQLMAAQGYQTFFSGKWHIKAPAPEVFEVTRHVRGGMPKQTDAGYNRPQSPDDHSWLPWDKDRGGFWEGGTHWSEVLGNDAVDYMNIAKADDRPFFMYLAFNAPHDPRQSPKSFVDQYPADQISMPADFLPEYPYEIGSNRIRDEKLAPFPRTKHAIQVNRQEYYAIVTHMDEQIGRILDALEETGQADNTWIFFTADHGLACGHHGLLGKQNMYDHSVRVPFVVCGPSAPANKSNSRRIYLQSVMATALELAGAGHPNHVQFDSLLEQLHSDNSERQGTAYGAYTDHQRMITVDDHKLILYPKISKRLLFDLRSDPLEMHDLSEQPETMELQKTLFARLQQEQIKTGDNLNLTGTFSELTE
jgi:arylsulfatase A-like enzyme